MKTIIALALLFVSVTNFAQEKTKDSRKAEMEKLTPEQRNELHVKKLALDLNLNVNQQKELGELMLQERTKMEAARTEHKAEREEHKKLEQAKRQVIKDKMLQEQVAFSEKVKKVLTPEQFQKWNEIKEKHREDRKEKHEKFRSEKREWKDKKEK